MSKARDIADLNVTILDSVESGATADQTNAEIRAAVEAATDSHVFTDADHTKLNSGVATVVGSETLTNKTLTSPDLNTPDIDGGTIDGTVIGGATPAAISGTTGQFGTSLNVDGTATVDALVVDGDILASTATGSTFGLVRDDTTTGINSRLGLITFSSTEDNGSTVNTGASITSLSEQNHSTIASGSRLAFNTTPISSTTALERLNIANNGDISFYEDTGSTPKLFWDASAESLGIGTASPAAQVDISSGTTSTLRLSNTDTALTQNQITGQLEFSQADSSASGAGVGITGKIGMRSVPNVGGNYFGLVADMDFYVSGNASGYAYDNASKRALTIQAGTGSVLVGKTSSNLGTDGVELRDGTSYITNTSASPLAINREGTDGQLVGFYNDEVAAGAINVSGGVVSYTAFMGSHYAETVDTDLLFGTVMEVTGELVDQNYTAQGRLSKVKVSDTSESRNVYGVWIGSYEGGGETVAALGASWCRISSDVTVEIGDLLVSNGDGTAKVQSDDIIRSMTIGKVTSTTAKKTHADRSYVLPVVLYCG